MSFLASLIAWANVPFTVALGVAVAFALLQASGVLGLLAGGGDGDGDADADADADADVDAHADVDADADADVDAHADVDADADSDVDADSDSDSDADQDGDDNHGHGVGHHVLAGLGVGRAPLSIIWQTYAVSFAFAGLAANAIYLGRAGDLPLYTLAWTLPLGLSFGYVTTRAFAGALGRLVADPRQEATSRADLLGQTAIVISSRVSADFGEVRLMDRSGHVVRLICHTREDEPAIEEGREVVVVDYDRDRDRLFVAPFDALAPPQRRAAS